MKTPNPILTVRHEDSSLFMSSRVLCPGFELKKFRITILANNLVDWLPDFAIRQDELPEDLTSTTEFRRLFEKAVARVYKTEKSANRGEIGELLLHIACRQITGTFPTVSKVYYKTASNDVVKGFDLVHTRYNEATTDLELWLGEAKFYVDADSAILAAITSINDHLAAGFLHSEKLLLGGKISKSSPGYDKIQWLFDQETSLDEIFSRLVIPILIAYESEHCLNYEDEKKYQDAIVKQVQHFQTKFASKLPADLEIQCFYIPLSSKAELVAAFDKKLGAYT